MKTNKETPQVLALQKLINENGGEFLAAELGITISAIRVWLRRGQITEKGAQKVHESNNINMTREELRPDVKVWF